MESYFTRHKLPIFLFTTWSILSIGITFNNGVFWDDWSLINQPKSVLHNAFDLDGTANAGIHLIHYYFLKLFNQQPIAYRIFTTLLYGFIWVMFYQILLLLKTNKSFALTASIIALVLPLNFTKFIGICFPYTIHLALFMLGTYLFTTSIYHKNKKLFIPAGVAFMLSFVTNSLLVYFVVVPLILAIYCLQQKSIDYIKENKIQLMGMFSLPILFWIIRYLFLSPKGLTAMRGYNSISRENLWEVPSACVHAVISAFKNLFLLDTAILYLPGILVVFVIIASIKSKLVSKDADSNNYLLYLLIGLGLIVTACFPYIMVSKPPLPHGFEDRHQLLMPFGISISIASVLFVLSKYTKLPLYFILGIVLVIGVTKNMDKQLSFLNANYKYQSLKNFLKAHRTELEGKAILFTDKTTQRLPTDRAITNYELNGICYQLFNNERTFNYELQKATNKSFNIHEFLEQRKLSGLNQYARFSDYQYDSTQIVTMEINQATKVNLASSFKLLKLSLFNNQEYTNELPNYFNFTVAPIKYP